MSQVTDGKGRAENGSVRVEDLIFLDDLRALGVPWIDRLIDPCTSREDVKRTWTLICMWGPDYEDAKEMSAQMPQLVHEVQKILAIIRVCEDYRS